MTTKQPKKAAGTKKTITIKEIKFWLEGITEFQDDDWVPNAEQWRTVREKIMSLKEDSSEVVYTNSNNKPKIPLKHEAPKQQHQQPVQQRPVPIPFVEPQGQSGLAGFD
jgi:hypothetical protein